MWIIIAIWSAAAFCLVAACRSLFRGLRHKADQAMSRKTTWALGTVIVVGGMAALAVLLGVAIPWWSYITDPKEFHLSVGDYEWRTFFTSIRSLDLLSGISPLVPLFLVSMAGFLWAVSSFRRIRSLERFAPFCIPAETAPPVRPMSLVPDEPGNELPEPLFISESRSLAGLPQNNDSLKDLPVFGLETALRRLLKCSTFHLPGALAVSLVALCACGYLFYVQVVHAFENLPFYILVGVGLLLASLGLWLGVLRFWCVWQATHNLLAHLYLTPMRHAYGRLRKRLPGLPKIDLAMPAPGLVYLQCSVDQARSILQQFQHLADARAIKNQVRQRAAAAIAGGGVVDAAGKSDPTVADDLPDTDYAALQVLCSQQMRTDVEAALHKLDSARKEQAAGDWQGDLKSQLDCQTELSKLAAHIEATLERNWWQEMRRDSAKPENTLASRAEAIVQLSEEFLAGRVTHFLAHVFAQMRNLIYTSVAGLLLMLFAVSSYPFQPHDLLLLSNWTVILTFVGAAMWVFFEMNRDPVLSSLNGTKPGQITWDRELVLRIFIYGVVPILALLGAQFPETFGQILSHFSPAEAMHP